MIDPRTCKKWEVKRMPRSKTMKIGNPWERTTVEKQFGKVSCRVGGVTRNGVDVLGKLTNNHEGCVKAALSGRQLDDQIHVDSKGALEIGRLCKKIWRGSGV